MSIQEKIMATGKVMYMLNVPNVEIARTLDVSETTVSNWVTKGNWREERSDQTSRKKARMDMLGDLIDYQLEALHQFMSRGREMASVVAEQERIVKAGEALYMIDCPVEDIADVLQEEEAEVEKWIKSRGWQEKRATQHMNGRLMPLDKGEVDALAKMFAQVKGKELTFDNLVNLIRELLEFLNQKSPDLAKALVPYTNDFLFAKKEVLAP
ncbi:hypothetical protein [Spirosoma lituiforme]